MAPKKISSIFVLVLPLLFNACTTGPNSRMGNWNHMMGYGYGGGFMWILLLILVVVVIYAVAQITKSKGSSGTTAESPLDILKKRYAKGEIDKEEFDSIKRDLE